MGISANLLLEDPVPIGFKDSRPRNTMQKYGIVPEVKKTLILQLLHACATYSMTKP